MKTRTAGIAASVLIVLAVAGDIAMAQDRGPRGWGMMERMMDGPMTGRGIMRGYGHMMGYNENGMLDRIDGRLAFVKAELKIREDQTGKWDALAMVIRNNAEVHNDMMRSMMDEMDDGEYSEKSLPERLTVMETHMEARLEQIRAVRQALDDLYAVLDEDQKKAADEIVLPMMGMGPGGRMMSR